MNHDITPAPSPHEDYLREMSGVERWFYWMDQHRTTHFSISAEISGFSTPSQWRGALDQLQRRHPLLNAEIKQTDDGGLHFKKGGGAAIPLTVRARHADNQWREIASSELSKPFDSAGAPLFRAVLLDGGDRCTVILSAHHAIADGKSVAFLLRDLVQAAAGGTLSPLTLRPSQDTLLAPYAASLAAGAATPEDDKSAPPRPVRYQVRGAGPARIDSVQLTRNETRALEDTARAEGTTVHAAIVAAAILAGRTISPAWREHPVRVFSPISIRQLLAVEEDSMIALSAGITASDPAEHDSLWALARDVKGQLLPQQQATGVVGTLGFFELSSPSHASPATVSQLAADHVGFELMVTNLGKAPFPSVFGHLTIDALWGPVVDFGIENEQAISVNTINERACLVHSSMTPLPGLLGRTVEILKNELAPLHGAAQAVEYSKRPTTDAELVKSLPGFSNATAQVNGTTLHYVIGGKGEPLVLLPGWPQTWWAFHKIMPELAKHYQVIAVDLRGMGSSAKPSGGYDKKNMAKDIHELVRSLGHEKAHIVGHDIGSQVAWSYGANFSQATNKLVLIDLPHVDESLYSWPILPALNTFGDKVDENHVFAWWFAFHQVKSLPEKLLAGRVQLEQEWFFTYVMKDESALTPLDRAVYANAYQSADAIRAGNAWYQAFPQDIEDQKAYGKLTMPVLGLASTTYGWLQPVLAAKATNATTVKVNSGHLIPEEAPTQTLGLILDFLK